MRRSQWTRWGCSEPGCGWGWDWWTPTLKVFLKQNKWGISRLCVWFLYSLKENYTENPISAHFDRLSKKNPSSFYSITIWQDLLKKYSKCKYNIWIKEHNFSQRAGSRSLNVVRICVRNWNENAVSRVADWPGTRPWSTHNLIPSSNSKHHTSSPHYTFIKTVQEINQFFNLTSKLLEPKHQTIIYTFAQHKRESTIK